MSPNNRHLEQRKGNSILLETKKAKTKPTRRTSTHFCTHFQTDSLDRAGNKHRTQVEGTSLLDFNEQVPRAKLTHPKHLIQGQEAETQKLACTRINSSILSAIPETQITHRRPPGNLIRQRHHSTLSEDATFRNLTIQQCQSPEPPAPIHQIVIPLTMSSKMSVSLRHHLPS